MEMTFLSLCVLALVRAYVFMSFRAWLHGWRKKSCVIVVSPLISLMVDQVRNLRVSGVEAIVISSVSRQSVDKEFLANEENLRSCSFIYSSPEA